MQLKDKLPLQSAVSLPSPSKATGSDSDNMFTPKRTQPLFSPRRTITKMSNGSEADFSRRTVTDTSSESEAGSSKLIQMPTLPLACSTTVKKVPATKIQPLTDSPVPCGESFFEDVNSFTQSHMTYMRGFKTSALMSPTNLTTAPPDLTKKADSFSEPVTPASMYSESTLCRQQLEQCKSKCSSSPTDNNSHDFVRDFQFDYSISSRAPVLQPNHSSLNRKQNVLKATPSDLMDSDHFEGIDDEFMNDHAALNLDDAEVWDESEVRDCNAVETNSATDEIDQRSGGKFIKYLGLINWYMQQNNFKHSHSCFGKKYSFGFLMFC